MFFSEGHEIIWLHAYMSCDGCDPIIYLFLYVVIYSAFIVLNFGKYFVHLCHNLLGDDFI